MEYKFDFGIVCALKKELKSILDLNFNWKPARLFKDNESLYHIGTFTFSDHEYKIVCISPNEMGIAVSSIATLKLIEYFKPKYLFMTGIMAGIRDKTNLGNILIAEPSWHYEVGKYLNINGERIFQPTTSHVRASEELLSLIEEIAYDKTFLATIHDEFESHKPPTIPTIHIGPVGSGSAVIADDSIIKEILEHERKLLGIDMEIYGFYLSAYKAFKPKPSYIAIKSVSDFADGFKNDDFQDYGSYIAARLLEKVIKNKITVETTLFI